MKNIQKQKNKWGMKKLGVDILLIFFGVFIIVVVFEFPQFFKQFELFALLLTFGVLILYTNETMLIRKETVKQTELKTMPVMVLYIRNVGAITDRVKKISIRDKYALTFQSGNAISPSGSFIALRNMGDGPAFDVRIESKNFKAYKYQTRFFAPKKDEHAVKIIKKPSDKIRDISKLNNEIFTIKCRSVLGRQYEYKYKIIDIENKDVEFVK
ncbi:MAG: hypothetical protein U9P50_02000 [Patescibacteria group bacterium]|nr:hypothetical protein [Patescibacteria group bacterium]